MSLTLEHHEKLTALPRKYTISLSSCVAVSGKQKALDGINHFEFRVQISGDITYAKNTQVKAYQCTYLF